MRTSNKEVIIKRIYGDKNQEVGYEEVAELVRCKDCIHRQKVLNCSYGECMYSASMVTDNDFCSNGERKTGQEKWDV